MFLAAVLYSIGGLFIKLIPWGGMAINGGRTAIALVVIGLYLAATRHKPKMNLWVLVGALAVCGTNILFSIANKLTTAANAIVLQFTAPVFILILSALVFRQRFARADVAAVLLTMCGIALFFLDQLSPGSLLGNIVAIGAGLSMAVMYIATGRADEESRMNGILIGHLFTAAVGVPCMFLFDTPVSTPAVLSILALGIVQLGIPYVLYGIAVKDCPPLVCSLIGALEPLLNPVWVFLFTGERPGLFALIGGAVVIVTITAWCVQRDRAGAAGKTV